MSESRTLRYGTIVAAIAASVAALAASAQSYVAWHSRFDTLKTTIVSANIQKCTEASAAIEKLKNYQKYSMHLDRISPGERTDVNNVGIWLDLANDAWLKLIEVETLALTTDLRSTALVNEDRDAINIIIHTWSREANQSKLSLGEHQKFLQGVVDAYVRLDTKLRAQCIVRINSQIFGNTLR